MRLSHAVTVSPAVGLAQAAAATAPSRRTRTGCSRTSSRLGCATTRTPAPYEVLHEPRADRIAQNLAPLNGGKKINAYEDPKCLACHTTPEFAVGNGAKMRALQAEGIGCEACHGLAPESGGLADGAHTERVEGEQRQAGHEDDERSAGAGAGLCRLSRRRPADPKNGVPARDLNHDLMAAGHPRLVFELSTFQANLPAHWRRDKYPADYEAKLWAAGRTESARASLDLLAFRAKDEQKPWPEFAEYNCFACHASLRESHSDFRYRPGYRDIKERVPGGLPYNEWFSTGLPTLAKSLGADAPDFAALARLMSKPSPDRKEVAKLVEATLEKLGSLSSKSLSKEQVGKLTKDLAAVDAKKLAALSWDEATQMVYGLTALYQANPGAVKSDDVKKQFAKVYELLAYPPGFESPAEFRKTTTPTGSDPLTTELGELLKLFGGS